MLRSLHTNSSENNVLDDVFEVSALDQQRFVDRVRESVHIKCHFQLLLWLQGDFQRCIPHQIFIAAWGDFSEGSVQHDVVSILPSVRTGPVANKETRRLIGYLFRRWVDQGARPFGYSFDDLKFDSEIAGVDEAEAFQSMRSALVHGIRDERGRHDCLYVFLNASPEITPSSLDNLRITLPFVDAALRQVAHLPCQFNKKTKPDAQQAELSPDQALSPREVEIMDWVKAGKTNYEIGIILNISTFTVKNHLQRIFRKLDVTNRAQASSQVKDILATPPLLDHCSSCPRVSDCCQMSRAAA